MSRFLLLLTCLALGGCYYLQAARGQLEVLHKREAIDKLVADPATPPEQVERLQLVTDARDFSIAELGMPDNGSYRSYSDLERDFVVWSVFAAPELSLDARTWCYPIVGCVAYRGYFREEKANAEADKLKEKGFDVHVGGVTAYSTLGRFDDPLLNTMMRWDDLRLIATLFHELAHQVLYIPDDTAFNESFASAVEDIAMQRYLASGDREDELARYRQNKAMQHRWVQHILMARDELAAIYDSDLPDSDKRQRKAEQLAALEDEIRADFAASGASADGLLATPMNNARLLSFSLYDGWVPAFHALYRRCNDDINCLYDEAARIGDMPPDERESYLAALGPAEAAGNGSTGVSVGDSRRDLPSSRQ